jgi:hypothetical protein
MDYGLVALVVGAVVTVASAVLGQKYVKAKGKVQALSGLLKSVVDALEDDQVSEEEFKKIVEQAKEFLKGE